MTKKFLSAIMALSMAVCTFTGCSDLDKDGNLKEALSYKTDEIYDVSYRVRNDFIKTGAFLDEPIISEAFYNYKLNFDVAFHNTFTLIEPNMSTQTKLDYLKDVVFYDESITTEIIKDEEYDIAVLTSESTEDDKTNRIVSYIISKQGHPLDTFTVENVYPVGEDEKLMRELSLEMLRSAEYVGEDKDFIKSSYDCKYYSVDIPSDKTEKFKCVRYGYDGGSARKIDVELKYNYADSLTEHLSKIVFTAHEGGEAAEEYLGGLIEKYTDEDHAEDYTIIEAVTAAEILGFDGYRIVYKRDELHGFPKREFTEYAFYKNGILYSVKFVLVDCEGKEQIFSELEKLIDSIKIK